jgi:1,2-dihydroxy-3-keto-5-methylthiopentene dioxygenase
MKAHWLEKGGDITPEVLAKNDVFYSRMDTAPDRYRVPLDEVKRRREYVDEDIVELGPNTPNLEAICAKFVDEHFHDDDEVRFVLEGEGIFDIRSLDDQWMRVEVHQGDLIIVPKDRHHRFLLTEKKAIRCVRLFKDTKGWAPHYRAKAAAAS